MKLVLESPAAFGHWVIENDKLDCRLPRKTVTARAPRKLLMEVLRLCDGSLPWSEVLAGLGRRWAASSVAAFMLQLVREGKHRLGHVDAMDEVELDTATHWSHRESCQHCPVLQLCKGSCMYLHDNLFAQSCENEYHYNMAILGGILKSVTGLTLQSVSGDIRRPAARRVFMMATA